MDSGSSAPAPDNVAAANATADGNMENLKYQTVANRPTQITPWGTSTWSNSPTTGSDGKSVDNWTQNLTLTPAEQAALSDQQSIKANQSDLARSLQGQVASTMANGFNAPQLSSYTSGVGAVKQDFANFNPIGVNSVNQTFNPIGVNNVNQSFNSTGQKVDTNAPVFSDATAAAGAKAAYDGTVGLMQPQMQQDTKNLDTQLQLKGLVPGTEAYNNAYQNLARTQSQTLTALAKQSVATGNQLANTNYASQLAGYGAKNAATGQQFAQDSSAFALNNSAQQQAYNQALSSYGANNSAQQQAYNQALASYGANASAQTNSNAAQAQAQQQALQNYSASYTSALANYNQPLNAMNSVLTGQQVSQPTMPTFATAGYTNGADITGATNATSAYNQAQSNASAAANNSTTSAVVSAGMMAAMMY